MTDRPSSDSPSTAPCLGTTRACPCTTTCTSGSPSRTRTASTRSGTPRSRALDERGRLDRPATLRDSAAHAGRGVSTKRSRRTAMAVLGAAMALVLPIAAGGPATADARSLESVTIATPPFEPTALAFYADARGFFRKHGIEAKIVVLPDPGATAAAIVAGDAKFGPADIGGIMLGKSRGLPVKLVAGGAIYQRQHPTAALVSAPGKRFARARDLVGRTVGVDRTGSIAYVALLTWLKRGGIRRDAVELSYHAVPDMIGRLSRGKIDAAILPEPYLTQAKQRG